MPDDENLYTPPRATVADPQSAPALATRPRQVRDAVRLMWVGWALTFPMWLLGAMRQPEEFLSGGYIGSMVFLLALSGWLNVLIYRGRNWARMVSLAFLLLSIAVILFAPDESSQPGFMERLLTFAGVCVETVALALIFRQPGAQWFRNSNGQSR